MWSQRAIACLLYSKTGLTYLNTLSNQSLWKKSAQPISNRLLYRGSVWMLSFTYDLFYDFEVRRKPVFDMFSLWVKTLIRINIFLYPIFGILCVFWGEFPSAHRCFWPFIWSWKMALRAGRLRQYSQNWCAKLVQFLPVSVRDCA